MAYKAKPIAERFWRHVDIRGPDDCWPWLASLYSNGYGQFHFSEHVNTLAHRMTYELTYGAEPIGLCCHKCNNRKCCNPKHLYDGTYSQNTQQAVAETQMNQGQKQGSSVLTNDSVREMKLLLKYGHTRKEMMERYSVKYWTVRAIDDGMTWGWLNVD